MKTMNGFDPSHSHVSAVFDTRPGGYILAAGAAVLYPVLRVLLDRYVFMVRFRICVHILMYQAFETDILGSAHSVTPLDAAIRESIVFPLTE